MLSGIVSLILLVLFIVGSIWVWSPHCRDQFEAAARMPLEDSDGEQTP
jgi:cytochrome c oxidase cbb3-type subunit 4